MIESEIIKVENDFVIINFLDEQKDERIEQSKQKSKGGKASAEARRLKKLAEQEQEVNKDLTGVEHVLDSCSTESQLLREEKRREEDIRKDIKDGLTPTQKVLNFEESEYEKPLVDGFKRFCNFIEQTKHVLNIQSQINIDSYKKICEEYGADRLKEKIKSLDDWLDDPNVAKGKKKKKSLTHLMTNTWLKNGY